MLLDSNLASHIMKVYKLWRNSLIILIKNEYLLKIWLKWLNLFLKMTILSFNQIWKIKYLEQLLVRNPPHHMHVYIYGLHDQIQSWILFRYIDIFFIWTTSEKELDDFLEQLNNFHPNLKFSHEHSREEINFLNIAVRVNHCEFIASLYCKPTDGH